MKFTSQLIKEAVDAFGSLPGIGKKTALRLVLFLANQDPQKSEKLSNAVNKMIEGLKSCRICHAYSDHEICEICSNPLRDQTMICVVESIRDLMAIEETQQYRGVYHVLGGLISPIEGVGPDQINIDALIRRIKQNLPQEMIMALRPSIEGDTTMYYISRQPECSEIRISQIARGISFGSELEFADEFTLSKSLSGRIPYNTVDNSRH